jgi:5'-nucleotidase
MRILLSNDDGYAAPGLCAVRQVLAHFGTVTVIAPERNRSGASNSLTLDRPLRLQTMSPSVYAIDGTPADCVNLALTGALAEGRPDLVVSGINTGENLGEDVLYSGTVAAAMEGALHGLPAIAVSLAGADETTDFKAAAASFARLLQRLLAGGLAPGSLLNVNLPATVGNAEFEVTRLGRRHRDSVLIPTTDPRGRTCFWVGPIGSPGRDGGPGTDFHAIARGRISVTPLQTDLTDFASLEPLGPLIHPAAGGDG